MHARNSSQAHYLNIPGPGRNPLKASSALIRHSIECPLSTISSCRRNPSHKLNTQYFMFRTFFLGGEGGGGCLSILCLRLRYHLQKIKIKRLIIKVPLFHYLFVPEFFSHSYTNLFLNQVHRGDHFCHRMLNLNPTTHTHTKKKNPKGEKIIQHNLQLVHP